MEAYNYVNILLMYLLTANLIHPAAWNSRGNVVSVSEDGAPWFLDALPVARELLGCFGYFLSYFQVIKVHIFKIMEVRVPKSLGSNAN